MVLDRTQYDNAIKEIISDKTQFKELPEDVTLKREAMLQRFLRTLKNEKKCLNDVDYKSIYPSGFAPAQIYGTLKINKFTDSDSFPKLRAIVSSVGTLNYSLAKYLCNLLLPHLREVILCNLLLPHVCLLYLTFVNNTVRRTLSHL